MLARLIKCISVVKFSSLGQNRTPRPSSYLPALNSYLKTLFFYHGPFLHLSEGRADQMPSAFLPSHLCNIFIRSGYGDLNHKIISLLLRNCNFETQCKSLVCDPCGVETHRLSTTARDPQSQLWGMPFLWARPGAPAC